MTRPIFYLLLLFVAHMLRIMFREWVLQRFPRTAAGYNLWRLTH
jgi:hypothetical protein